MNQTLQVGNAAPQFTATAIGGEYGAGKNVSLKDFKGRKNHAKFIEKYALPFPLLSDESKKIVEAYGVWVEKSMYGKKYMGTERTTFVIGPDQKIRAIFRKVKPAEHAELLEKELAG